MQKITPNLWFNNNAKEAVDFYVSVFKDAKIIRTDYYTSVGKEFHGHNEGDVLTVEFELLGMRFIAINAGPEFKFTPAVSFMVPCADQVEIDHYWAALSAVPAAEQCGWLQDKYGLSWQIVPAGMGEMLKTGTPEQITRVTAAYMQMKKFDLAKLEAAFKGE